MATPESKALNPLNSGPRGRRFDRLQKSGDGVATVPALLRCLLPNVPQKGANGEKDCGF